MANVNANYSGTVLANGLEIKDIKLTKYYQKVAYIANNTHIMHKTINESFTFYNSNITEEKIFYDKNLKGISPLAGIEFMAQTVGCYAYFRNGGGEPKIGFLLGSRVYKNNIEKFELGKTYIIKAELAFSDNELVSFDCFIYNDGMECARATVNVYQPNDIENMKL